jgi:hypothetical protein
VDTSEKEGKLKHLLILRKDTDTGEFKTWMEKIKNYIQFNFDL